MGGICFVPCGSFPSEPFRRGHTRKWEEARLRWRDGSMKSGAFPELETLMEGVPVGRKRGHRMMTATTGPAADPAKAPPPIALTNPLTMAWRATVGGQTDRRAGESKGA